MNIRVNDIGTLFKTTIKDGSSNIVDLSSMTNASFIFERPDNTQKIVTPYLYTNGTDGILAYSTQSGDINQIGLYSFQAIVNFSGQTFHTSIVDFRTYRNL
jgi:hypothetical protein